MSSFMADLSGSIADKKVMVGNKEVTISRKGSNLDLDMTDFIELMIVQMTNQGIDDTMDTSEMLNQMVQMQMVTSMVNMTDAVTTNYAASLVGKEVTVGKYNSEGKLEEIVGKVQATGTMDGQQVVFVDDEYYFLSEIMAVGRLPEQKEEKPEGSDKTEGSDQTQGAGASGSTGSTGSSDTNSSGETTGAAGTGDQENGGGSGAANGE